MTYQELSSGANFIAKTPTIEVYEKDGLCYKIFDKTFGKADIFYEAMLHSLAEAVGINVPKIHGVIEIGNRYAICSDFAFGDTVGQLMEKHPEKRDEYLSLMLEIQLKIHSCVITDVKKLKHKLSREIEKAPIDDIKKYELQTRLASMPQHNKLCHGNFSPENIVIGENGKPVVLDWVAATRGNAAADVAKTYLRLTLISTEAAEKYISMFCEKTGTAKQYIDEWLPIIAASYLSGGKATDDERLVMMTWLDVAEY